MTPAAVLRTSGRDAGVDCARGLAMTLVVLGHSLAFALLSPGATAFVFTFHVPAFFFISGYLLRPDRFSPRRTAWRILIPFVAVGLPLALLKSALRGENPVLALAGLAWGTGATLPSSQLWFLPALFLALLLAAALARNWGDPLRPAAAAATLLALLLLGYLALHAPQPPVEALRRPGVAGPVGWAWSLDLAPLAAFYCLCGHLARRSGILERLGVWTLAPGLALALACFALGARTDLNLRLSEPFPLAVLAALGGTLAVFMLGRVAAAAGAIAAGLSAIGRHSIMILAFHVTVQNAAVAVALRLADRLAGGLAESPAVLAAATLLGLAAGLGAPLLLSVAFDRARLRLGPARPARPAGS